jgi:hypothetical protein
MGRGDWWSTVVADLVRFSGAAKTGLSAALADGNFGYFAKRK